MKNVILTRTPEGNKETLGELYANQFSCKTLELPWKDNKTAVSCIPTGNYICRWTRSNRLSGPTHDVFTYEVLDVPFRYGIRIHSANYFTQLLGCIALGSTIQDINSDNIPDITSSKDTIARFNLMLNQEDFKLIIQDAYSTSR